MRHPIIAGTLAAVVILGAAVFMASAAIACTKTTASWYGPGFHGRTTASGERFNQNAMTVAHRTLPFGSMLIVRNVQNGRSVQVRVNDRGPFVRGRTLDLSRAAAAKLGMINRGVARVCYEVL